MSSETQILTFLKRRGAQATAAIARHLKITLPGTRKHLGALTKARLVSFIDERRGVGRPRRLWQLTEEAQAEMAASLGANSLRYLPVESIARAITFDADQLCQACITGEYPSQAGQDLYQIALQNADAPKAGRTYESKPVAVAARPRG